MVIARSRNVLDVACDTQSRMLWYARSIEEDLLHR